MGGLLGVGGGGGGGESISLSVFHLVYVQIQ